MKRASVSERTLVEYLEPFRCKFYEHEASGLLWRKSHCRGTLRSATSQPGSPRSKRSRRAVAQRWLLYWHRQVLRHQVNGVRALYGYHAPGREQPRKSHNHCDGASKMDMPAYCTNAMVIESERTTLLSRRDGYEPQGLDSRAD